MVPIRRKGSVSVSICSRYGGRLHAPGTSQKPRRHLSFALLRHLLQRDLCCPSFLEGFSGFEPNPTGRYLSCFPPASSRNRVELPTPSMQRSSRFSEVLTAPASPPRLSPGRCRRHLHIEVSPVTFPGGLLFLSASSSDQKTKVCVSLTDFKFITASAFLKRFLISCLI